MPYAVNLAALTTIKARNDFVLKMLLKEVLDLEPSHLIESDTDKIVGIGVGARFACEEDRAAAIVAIIRQRYEHYELPVYYSKTGNGGWRYVKRGRK
jgi:hypothetical protein